MKSLLIANRGEIALRVIRAARELGLRTVAVFSEEDRDALHVRRADEARSLDGRGARAYLDAERIVALARDAGCAAIHPGYGFLSESADFAARCEAAGIVFVGPSAATLAALGDKTAARALAERCKVPVLRGTARAVTPAEAHAFLASLGARGAMVLKAVAGGGGRGMRVVRQAEELDEAYERAASEARAAFGDGALYAEELLAPARHVEIQIVGDDSGAVLPLGERECTIQRRHQKLVEIAPCPSLPPGLRSRLAGDAVRMARAVGYRSLGTFEFLVADVAGKASNRAVPGATLLSENAAYAFIEANPRLQVEHPVTEEVLDLDLVRIQLEIAFGRTLAEVHLVQRDLATRRGFAIEVRINAETIGPDGAARPAAGTLTAFEPPSGRGVRLESAAFVGMRVDASFDSLLAKVVVRSGRPRFADAVQRTAQALDELRIAGVATSVPLLRALLRHPDFVANRIDTGFLERHAEELVAAAEAHPVRDHGENGALPTAAERTLAGARVDPGDPLAVLAYGKGGKAIAQSSAAGATLSEALPTAISADGAPPGVVVVRAAMQGTIVSVLCGEGDGVREGQGIAVMSAMKMEHVLEAPGSGVVQRLLVLEGDTVPEGAALAWIEPGDVDVAGAAEADAADLDRVRPDLAELLRRRAHTLDAARPEAVERRRKTHQRTARENVDDLCDPGTFVEYGALAIAAQRQRRTLEDLIQRTPADGLIAGVGRVNGELFGDDARCAVLSYDYTVLAGTQGQANHRKKDRLFELAHRLRLPVVLFSEGGGGRPGDTDAPGVAGLDCMAFNLFAGLSGLVPLVGINSGRCFAGNAALLGCCDVVIATANSNIGMGGPAMIEGGGLGVFRPEEVGPMSVQVPNGVVDVAVANEAEAVGVAKQYLAFFQGDLASWDVADQRALRAAVPENRLRVYEVRRVLDTLADAGSVLELRRGFGHGMVTALARIEGRAIGVIANDPRHLAGAIDGPAADKAARFMQLCDAFDLPILFLCDTPGIMVGPEVEKTALVRHCCRMFVVGASLTVPFFTIVLRKSYGLGAQAMGGGSHKAPVATVAWPTGEFGGMGLEGAVKLGFRKELAAIEDPAERLRAFEQMVARAYERGKALNTATHLEIDDVIDPAESRSWLARLLRATPRPARRDAKKRPCVDTW